MPKVAKTERRPMLTPEAKENQMISLAMDCAERQMMEGTASSQVINMKIPNKVLPHYDRE